MGGLAEVDLLAREVADLQRRLLALRAEVAPAGPLSGGPDNNRPFLECNIEGVRLAVPLDHIREVILMCALSEIPDAPDWVPGLLNYRGRPVVVLDTQARFESKPRHAQLSDLILVCQVDQRLIGLIVKTVEGVIEVDPLTIESLTPGLEHARFVMGVLPGPGEHTLLLRLASLIATSDLPESGE